MEIVNVKLMLQKFFYEISKYDLYLLHCNAVTVINGIRFDTNNYRYHTHSDEVLQCWCCNDNDRLEIAYNDIQYIKVISEDDKILAYFKIDESEEKFNVEYNFNT